MNRSARRRLGALSVGVALLSVSALVALDKDKSKKKNGETAQPFYRKYLVAGDPLDDRILEQERLVAASPDSAPLRNDFGNLLAARRFAEQAKEQYEKALELDDSEYLAAYNLGLLYETQGKDSRAISAYRKSISRKPGFPHSHFRLGRLYERRGSADLAVSEYAKALWIDPAMRDPHHNPLVIDSVLMDRASLQNYGRDVAAASLASDLGYTATPRSRPRVDQPIWSDEVDPLPSEEPTPPQAPRVPATDTRPPRVAAPQAAPPPEPEVTAVTEEELAAPSGDERPPYIGGFRPTPTPPPPQ
jgi:tetratricopeptide (TPR) repeat protein